MAEQDPLIGTRLGKYRLVGRLGQGGMGVVYQGKDLDLQRAVAIKVLSASLMDDDSPARRFLLEARAAARINHPNVVAVYDIGQQGNISYIVMELVEGGSAQDLLLQHGALPWPQATRIIADVCRGLAAAHAAGMIHRDIKPANVLLGRGGSVKLTDFGLAKAPQLVPAHATHQGTVLGTPHYMSPEQCGGDHIDARTDLYALGGAYFALLTGRPPFEGQDSVKIMYAHCTAPVPDPRSIVPALPEACAALVLKAMAKNRADRFRSAQEMLTALTAVQETLPADLPPALVPLPALLALPSGPTETDQPLVLTSKPDFRPQRRRLVLVGPALAVVAIGLIVLGIAFFLPSVLKPPGQQPGAPSSGPTEQQLPALSPEGRCITLLPRPPWGKHEGEARYLAFGGRCLATVGSDKIAQVWRLDRPEAPAKIFKHSHELTCVALSPDGKWLATGYLEAPFVHLWDVDTEKEIASIDCQLNRPYGAWRLAFHPSGRRLAIGTGGDVQLVDLDAVGQEVQRRKLPERLWVVIGLGFTPDGRSLGVTSYRPGAYSLDGETLEKRAYVANPEKVELGGGLSFSADGKRMAYARKLDNSHELFIWEPETDQPPQLVTRETNGAMINGLAFAPGSRQIAHGGTFHGPVKLHDLATGQSVSYATGEHGHVTSLAFSPDVPLLAATCSDGSILAWDVMAVEP
jgi:serine/threonine protein kinase